MMSFSIGQRIFIMVYFIILYFQKHTHSKQTTNTTNRCLRHHSHQPAKIWNMAILLNILRMVCVNKSNAIKISECGHEFRSTEANISVTKICFLY